MSLFVRVVNEATGGDAEVPEESVAHWQRLGWEPVSDARSRAQADVEQAAREDEAAEAAQAVAADVQVATVPQILNEVGDDPALAAAALEAENQRDKPRVTLTDRLATIAGGNDSEES